MTHQETVESIKKNIEAKEIAKQAEHPREHSYMVTYDLKTNASQDIIRDVLLGLDAVQLSRSSYGFLTDLHPEEIKDCLLPVIESTCQRIWIVTVASPFDGKGEDVEHSWLWAMPDYEA